ncbi:MAG TPA: MATE family efflux transporter [Bacteroidales bacterium]|nr:MATE family efflux transporter [Bacteroidales bacterium]
MKDLTSGPEGKLIFQFAAPMLLGNVFQQLFNIADSIIVGNFIGKEALAAVGASFPVVFILISLVIGLVMGTTVVISQYFGARDMVRVKKAIDTMYISTFFGSILLTFIGFIFSAPLLRLLKLPEEIMPQTIQYLHIFIGGLILMFGYNGTSAALRGLGDSKTPLYFLIIATVANIILDILFVAFLKMGIAGAAYATVISNGIAFLLAAIYLNKTHKIINVKINGLIFDRDIFFQSLRIGLPNSIQQTIVALGGLVLMGIVNKFGTNVIAAFSVASRLDAIATVPAMSFAQAISAFTGQNIGANKEERIKTGLASTLKMMATVTFFTTLFIILAGKYIISLFTNDGEVIRIGAQYLTIVSLFYILFTLMFIYSGVMRGAGDSFMPMVITLLSQWIIRIPFAWIMSGILGVTGIWWSIPASWLVGFSLSYFYYKTGRWKKKRVVTYIEEF